MELSADPYAGARRAYQVLNPHATDTDWETWLAETTESANGGFDNFKAFARVCRQATALQVDPELEVAQHISFAAGYFEAMANVMASLLSAVPTSSCVPHHLPRIQAGLVNPNAQFE
jgi:hypothetical protein